MPQRQINIAPREDRASEGMTQLELDPQFTQGLRLLYSTNKDSAEQLRALLDEAIKQKYGPSKMLSNVLHKKVNRWSFVLLMLSKSLSFSIFSVYDGGTSVERSQ